MEEERNNQFTGSNYQLLQDPTFIKLKLDTSPLLQRTEAFIAAKKVVLRRDESTGELYEEEIRVGEPYANDEGVATIMSMLDLRANNHTVTGNMTREELYNFLADIRVELTEAIVLNCYEWGIRDNKLNIIIDTIMSFLRSFLSRVIDNKERESLIQGIKSTEVYSTVPQKTGVLQSFAGGMK